MSLLGGLARPALAIAFARSLSGMLYGVSVSDPMTLGGVVVLVLAVSVVPSLLPEIRAARLEPMQVLGEERRAHARAIARVGGQTIAYLPPLPRSDRECADDAGLVSGVFLPPRRATMNRRKFPRIILVVLVVVFPTLTHLRQFEPKTGRRNADSLVFSGGRINAHAKCSVTK